MYKFLNKLDNIVLPAKDSLANTIVEYITRVIEILGWYWHNLTLMSMIITILIIKFCLYPKIKKLYKRWKWRKTIKKI